MAIQDVVSHIGKTLGEDGDIPMSQIHAIVRVLGDEGALALLSETLEAEENGGLLLADGKTRRSRGGVFFQLARGKLPHAEKRNIFYKPRPAGPIDPVPPSSVAGSGAAHPSGFPRKRVIDVAPSRPISADMRGAFSPPELPNALARARVRQKVSRAIAPLPVEEQYRLLLDMLAEIHDGVIGGAAPTASDPPASSRHAKRSEPPGSSGARA
jgi:hypothetical protein